MYNRFAALDDHNSGGQQQQQQLKQTNGGGGSRSPPKQSLPPPPSTTITSTSPSSSYHGYNINDRALWNIVADKKTNAYNFRDDDAEVAKIINSPPSSSSSPSKGGSSPIKEAKNNSNSYNNNNNTSKNQKISTSSVVQDLRVVPPPSLQTNNTSYSSAAGHNIERQNIGQQFFTPYHTGGGGGGGGNGLNTSAANSAVSSAAPSAKSSPLPSRRGTEKHSVALTRAGHLVVEIPAPQRYLDKCAETRGREFTHIRYTAVTTNADEFAKSDSGFDLRPALLSRPTELFIVMTMYNEDETLFGKSMASVMRNIAYICSSSCPRTWGPNGWTNVVVCIVADGRSKIQRRVLDVLGLMGVYQDGIVKLAVGDKPVQAHLFEFTTQLCVDENLNVLGPQDGIVPVQVKEYVNESIPRPEKNCHLFPNMIPHLLIIT